MVKKEKVITWAIYILLSVSLISGGLLFSYVYSTKRASRDFDELAKVFQDIQKAEIVQKENITLQVLTEDKIEEDNKESKDEEADIGLAFQGLQDKNNDIEGWIRIKGTKINYPVMYTPNNPEYYLYRNFDKQYSVNGTPFIDAKSSMGLRTDNVLIHGHNMKDGSMFTELLLYKEEVFLRQHPSIEFYTSSGKQIYDIISVFETDIYDKGFKYYEFANIDNKDNFEDYVANVKRISLFDTKVNAEYGDELITLSTCAYHSKNGRFVVVGCMKK